MGDCLAYHGTPPPLAEIGEWFGPEAHPPLAEMRDWFGPNAHPSFVLESLDSIHYYEGRDRSEKESYDRTSTQHQGLHQKR